MIIKNINFPAHNKIGTMLDLISVYYRVSKESQIIFLIFFCKKKLLEIENDSRRKMFFMQFT